ncbi:DUF4158 domain-containing protein [Ensifer sp. BR816]|uniref:DUF4158 domain-containing protein n=1 Tax=Rhizobium sp. (strain BR816) TaxID=1057002 RepID=UPI00036FAF18|nr:DUF4158 domain-containing protein [Ensifer sp. BR816]
MLTAVIPVCRLNFDELALIESKPPRTRLGFAAQLKIVRLAGRFAEHAGDVAAEPVAYLAEQPTASFSSARAARSRRTGSKTRKYRSWLCTCCRTSTP